MLQLYRLVESLDPRLQTNTLLLLLFLLLLLLLLLVVVVVVVLLILHKLQLASACSDHCL